MLCAGVDPRSRLEGLPEPPPVSEAEQADGSLLTRAIRSGASLGSVVTGPLASLVLHTSVPGGRLLRREGLRRVRRGTRSLTELGEEVERSGVVWDGRLQIAVVELESGKRQLLDGSDARISVAAAVQASCAIPGVFRPIEVDGSSYVDGGAWSLTNLDAARVERGADVLCLNPTGSLPSGRRGLLALIGPWSRSVAAIEAAAVRRRGATVRVISPDPGSAAAMGANLMSSRRREPVIAAGLAQGRRLAHPD